MHAVICDSSKTEFFYRLKAVKEYMEQMLYRKPVSTIEFVSLWSPAMCAITTHLCCICSCYHISHWKYVQTAAPYPTQSTVKRTYTALTIVGRGFIRIITGCRSLRSIKVNSQTITSSCSAWQYDLLKRLSIQQMSSFSVLTIIENGEGEYITHLDIFIISLRTLFSFLLVFSFICTDNTFFSI